MNSNQTAGVSPAAEGQAVAVDALGVVHVVKTLDQTPVLRDVSLAVPDGSIACLLGPSGCGKTTLLRIVAGLLVPDSGHVFFAGEEVTQVPVHQRGFGLMFQDFALFPHRNVWDNVAFGLRMQQLPAAAVQQRVHEMLDLVDLTAYGQRRVYELSGGEQQRVALARSLAPHPRLLMLDEPLGSLDRTLRDDLMNELRRILKQIGLTALYVTHDQQEAFAVADQILVMNQGQIVQRGTPEAVYGQPASRFVAEFLGLNNLIAGQVLRIEPDLAIATALGTLTLPAPADTPPLPGTVVMVLIRPDAARACPVEIDAANCLVGSVIQRSFRGGHYQVTLQPAGQVPALRFHLPATPAPPAVGAALRITLDTAGLVLVPA